MAMDEGLANHYRPKTFSDVVGQPLVAIVLSRMVSEDKVPAGLLFSGPSGTGKTTTARLVALQLGPDSEIEEIDAASNGGVAEIRKVIDSLRYSSGANHRVIIIDEAQSMTREAFNALLKTLEEPPSGTVFVLVTSEPEKIPEVIKSRLTEFEFNRLSAEAIVNRLLFVDKEVEGGVSTDLLIRLATDAQGNMRNALNDLDLVIRADVKTVDEYNAIRGDHDFGPELVSLLYKGDSADIFENLTEVLNKVGNPNHIVDLIVECFRDILIIRAGGKLTVSGPRYDTRYVLAQTIEPERLLAALRLVWDLKTKIRPSENPRGNLELAAMLLSEVFTRGKQQAPVGVQTVPPVHPPKDSHRPEEPQRKLTFAEMQERIKG